MKREYVIPEMEIIKYAEDALSNSQDKSDNTDTTLEEIIAMGEIF